MDEMDEYPSPPPGPKRNGLDPEPKEGSPDFSKVPCVRSWQMSPFSKERFDLNEVQIAQKMGYKFRAEAKRLKELYFGGSDPGRGLGKPKVPPCPVCAEREEKEQIAKACKGKAGTPAPLVYRPYGPSLIPAQYCRMKPERAKYCDLGPSIFNYYQVENRRHASESCPSFRDSFMPRYRPYGPAEPRKTPKGSFIKVTHIYPANLVLASRAS